MDRLPIVAITGTKGKTSVVGLLSSALVSADRNVLAVDTSGHFINEKRKSSHVDSKRIWNLLPTRAPGRYLWEFFADPRLMDGGVAVLEASVGCAESGLGYKNHDIGVFLNVFEDHIGRPGIGNREELACAKKSFIFNNLKDEGSFAVFNADDELVSRMAKEAVSEGMSAKIVPVGIDFSFFDLESHLDNDGFAFTIDQDKRAILVSKGEEIMLADLKKVALTVGGNYAPGVINALFACAVLGILDLKEGGDGCGLARWIESAKLSNDSGRMQFFELKNDAEVIVDYAHEAHSLKAISDLARKRKKQGGRTIGVVRLAYRRGGQDLLKDAAGAISEGFDEVFVYDKFDYANGDAASRKAAEAREAAEYVVSQIKALGGSVEHYQYEKDAVGAAVKVVSEKDVLVAISNDDAVQSLGYIKPFLKEGGV